MKVRKRITIVADVLVDEDFDTNFLCVCENQGLDGCMDNPEVYVGQSENFEVLDYVSQDAIGLGDK